MRINGISAYRVELPLHEGSYKWSGGNSVDVFDSTVVAIQTDAGNYRLRRDLPVRPGLSGGVCGGGARGDRGNRLRT